MTVLLVKNLQFELGGKVLFKSDQLTIEEGDRIGLIGRNGAGKTCLLKILSGQLTDFSGQLIGNPLTYYGEFTEKGDTTKSGGEFSILSFFELLREGSTLYLLDEPTTYLDKDNHNKVRKAIESSDSTFCIATHDRALLEANSTKIWAIERGEIREYKCTYLEYLQERKYERVQYEAEIKQYTKDKKKLKKTIQSMKEKKDKKKGKPSKMSSSEYRIAGVKTKIGVKQKKLQKGIIQQEKKLHQLQRPKQIEEKYDISFLSQKKKYQRKQVLIPEHRAIIENKELWSIPGMTLNSGDKLGIVGKNGSGKTTYLNYIVSTLPLHLKVAYFRQNQIRFKKQNETVYNTISEVANDRFSESQLRTLLALLDFKREKVFKQVSQLSQGEQVKLALLASLVVSPDVLLLDEITNFLDLKTIEAVEEVLNAYSGILIFVSHDSYFVENLANQILDIDHFKGD